MVQSAEDFLNYFKKWQLEHIADNLFIDYVSSMNKSDLIDLIISEFLPNGLLNKRRIKKILDMFYKYQIKDICYKLGGEDFSGLNYEELKEYIANLTLDKEDEEFDEERLAIINSIREQYSESLEEYTPNDFLNYFLKDYLKHIADQLDIEYDYTDNKNDLIDLIASNHFTNDCLERNEIEIILDMFYKYELKEIFSKISEYSFSRFNYEELKDLIANHFLLSEDYYDKDSEVDVDELFEEEVDFDEDSVKVIKVLLCGSQPKKTGDIDLLKEYEILEETIRSSPLFHLRSRYNITLDIFNTILSDFKPNILHLSAHGNKDEILFQDRNRELNPIKIDSIAGMIDIHNRNKTDDDILYGIILSSCQSAKDAMKLAKKVLFVIAMSDEILVDSAIEFSEGFYSGLKSGKSIQDAFELGIALIEDEEQKRIPQLLPKNKDFSQVRLINYQ